MVRELLLSLVEDDVYKEEVMSAIELIKHDKDRRETSNRPIVMTTTPGKANSKMRKRESSGSRLRSKLTEFWYDWIWNGAN